MLLNEFTQPVAEGPNDPHIFKAVFMAGSPGSGKTTVAKAMFAGTGLKVLNVDNFHNFYLSAGKEINHKHFHHLVSKQRDVYQQGRLGLLIDGTARRIDRLKAVKEKLDSMGYDSIMVFVNTDLETCLKRAKDRELNSPTDGRHVDEELIKTFWLQTQKNLGLLQQMFGYSSFYLIDNSHHPDLNGVAKRVHKWLDTPVNDYVKHNWLKAKSE
jgi:predicted kinase